MTLEILLAIITTLTPVDPELKGRCGLPPLPPLGCSNDQKMCVCDRERNCEWVFVCD